MHERVAKTILSTQNGLNIYRGGVCSILSCDAKIASSRFRESDGELEAKVNAPELLEATLRRKQSRCMIMVGSASEPYPKEEEETLLMRRSLEVIDRMEFGVSLRTKSLRMLRDLDILESIQRKTRCVVEVMLTTADEALAARLEPTESTVGERLELLRALRDAGIPTVVTLGPVLPYLTDSLENLEALLGDCVEARVYGVIQNGFGVTLRAGSSAYFFSCLRELDPELPEKYEALLPPGKPRKAGMFLSPNAAALADFFQKSTAACRLVTDQEALFAYRHAFLDRRAGQQLSLFDLFET